MWKPRIENRTITVLALFIGIMSFLLGLGSLGIVYFKLGTPQFMGAFLLLAGTILFTEEFSKGKLLSKLNFEKLLMLFLIVFAYGLGFWQLVGNVLSKTMAGVAGVIYIILGIAVVYQLFK